MAGPTVLKFVQNRLPTSHNLSTNEATELQEFIDEAMVRREFVDGSGDPDEASLTRLQAGYVADLAAIDFLNSRLNRYMEDAKVKAGGDGVELEMPDKKKYIEQQINRLLKAAEEKAAMLGFGGAVATGFVAKVIAKDESEDE